MKAVIISGGCVDLAKTKQYLYNEDYDYLIVCDKGLEAADRLSVTADLIVGDFDSVSDGLIKRYEADPKTAETVMRFKPEKDYSDTHLAVERAIKAGADEIVIFGATGSRLDHVLANLSVQYMALKKNVNVTLIDLHNRIRMVDSNLIIADEKQYGKYVSVIPYAGDAKVTLTGFKYPLDQYILECDMSMGLSNEIVEKEARIDVISGVVCVIESVD